MRAFSPLVLSLSCALASAQAFANQEFHTDKAFAFGDLDIPVGARVNPVDIHDYLVDFHREPKSVMNRPLAKRDQSGRLIEPLRSPFETSSPDSEDLLKARDAIRSHICAAGGRSCASGPAIFAETNDRNQVGEFLWEKEYIGNLLELEAKGLQSAILQPAPWSDSFWPTYRGLIARRWLDKSYPTSQVWQDYYDYYLANPPGLASAATLSAAEKYDLLVGDSTFGLTNANWGSGLYAQKKYGSVPTWQGLCHGWSPASYMTENPKRSVTVLAADGAPITFNPSDIKALAAQAWGSAPPRVNFVGTRCEISNPKEDENGRVIDSACFDVNPATWHMAITNQIGVAKRSMIFDSTYDFQVWNYPLDAYSYRYFNPQTLAVSDKLAGAVIRKSEFTIDKFKSYRSPKATFVAGVAMDVTYVVPIEPSARPVPRSSFHTIRYVYDLELDANGNMIGGEWYSNFHPDFIWNPPVDGKPISVGERQMSAPITWDGIGPLPPRLQAAARISSPRQQPLGAVVETLVRMGKTSR